MNTDLTPEQEFNILLLVPNFRNKLLGVNYLISRFNLKDDKYLLPIYQDIAEQIQSPLEEWETRFNIKD
jgi:hypothetical protein